MRLLIAGSRDIQIVNKDIDIAMEYFKIEKPAVVLCGMAPGPDRAGLQWAKDNGICTWKMPGPWDALGKRAGPYRNASMAKLTDNGLVFWDGRSPGTENMIRCLQDVGASYHLIMRE